MIHRLDQQEQALETLYRGKFIKFLNLILFYVLKYIFMMLKKIIFLIDTFSYGGLLMPMVAI